MPASNCLSGFCERIKFLQYSIFLVRYSLFYPSLLISNIEQGIKNKEVEILNIQ